MQQFRHRATKGKKMAITLPKTVSVICMECNSLLETNWTKYGATEPCFICDAAPVYLVKQG
jgi:hypothetical protein